MNTKITRGKMIADELLESLEFVVDALRSDGGEDADAVLASAMENIRGCLCELRGLDAPPATPIAA